MADLYRRLHVIIGDANHCDVANLLKLGTTSLVLAMIEDRFLEDDLTVNRPVHTLHQVARPDLPGDHRAARRDPAHRGPARATTSSPTAGCRTSTRASSTRTRPTSCGGGRWFSSGSSATPWRPLGRDWVAKLKVLQGYIDRDGLEVVRPPAQGHRHPVVGRAARQGALPPAARRRPLRGARHRRRGAPRRARAAHRHPPTSAACAWRSTPTRSRPSWDSVIFDVPGHSSLQRVPDARALRALGRASARCSTEVWTLLPFFASWHRHRARVALGSSPGTQTEVTRCQARSRAGPSAARTRPTRRRAHTGVAGGQRAQGEPRQRHRQRPRRDRRRARVQCGGVRARFVQKGGQ